MAKLFGRKATATQPDQQQLQARYAELLGYMRSVKDQVDWWVERFPRSRAAQDLFDDFYRIFKPFEDIYNDLTNGRASWENPALSEILESADKMRAATLDHMSLVTFQVSCEASEEDDPAYAHHKKSPR